MDQNNLIVYLEIEDGRVADVSLELLTKGRVLAEKLGVKLEAVASLFQKELLFHHSPAFFVEKNSFSFILLSFSPNHKEQGENS